MQEFSARPNDGDEEVSSGSLPPGPEATEMERLQAELAEAEREKAQFKSLAQRAQADFANYRKRADEEKQEVLSNASAQVILRILPVLDDVERAMSQAPTEGSGAENSWLEGFRLIERKLNGILEGEGLQRIEAEGAAFNPWEHEIVSYQNVPGRKEGEVLEVTRQGYKMNGKVLRPAQVVVVKASESGPANEADETITSTQDKEG